MNPWWSDVLSDRVNIVKNENVAGLLQKAIESQEGELSADGSLVIKTGKFTGRAADDKYVVRDGYSENRIHWENVKSLTERQFGNIRQEFVKEFNRITKTVYISERSVGADIDFSLGVRLITTEASHALFAHHIFREPLMDPKLGSFTIFHIPYLELDAQGLGLRSSTVIAINFETQEILIAGTAYAGEIKKSVFSVMNTLLPDHGVLPMHAGSNIDEAGKVSAFFGLSGTGKTTLSTDKGRKLIGDDEHGISSEGIFNIEGGCYAKTYNLTEKREPQVYRAVNRFGAILENVVLDEEHRPIFTDKTITENGRGSYPLSYIDDASTTGMGPFPKNIFFLSADAMGVLPVVAKLDTEQAMFYFLSGYTAKLADTELGFSGIKATFSHCFGAPFMMRHPSHYSELLKKYLESHETNVWLINTGWYGGAYGVGKRYDLSVTRSIVREIQKGLPVSTTYWKESCFNLNIPENIPGVDKRILDPKIMWADKSAYVESAQNLNKLFMENFSKFSMEKSL